MCSPTGIPTMSSASGLWTHMRVESSFAEQATSTSPPSRGDQVRRRWASYFTVTGWSYGTRMGRGAP